MSAKRTIARPRIEESSRLNRPLRTYVTQATESEIDRLVLSGAYRSRSDLISTAIEQLLQQKRAS